MGEIGCTRRLSDVKGHGMSLGFRTPMTFRRSAMSSFQPIIVQRRM